MPVEPGGALEAAVETRIGGLTRFIGVTGHEWAVASMHRRTLERFDFDSVSVPWNLVMSEIEGYHEDFDAVLLPSGRRRSGVRCERIGRRSRGHRPVLG